MASTVNSQKTAQKASTKVKSTIPSPPTFTTKQEEREYLKTRLALAFRIFAKHGFEEGVAGHITVRDPISPTTFWVNPFGVAFSQITPEDLIQVNHEGKVIAGGKEGRRHLNSAAFMIHSAIHRARPDVLCAAHSHSIYGRAFCALGRELDIISQDACSFWNVCPLSSFTIPMVLLHADYCQDHVVYKQFNGVVLAEEEGENIAAALGSKKAALLQNHGLLTVGQSIEEAVYWFTSLEKCCQEQLLADAAAAGRGGKTVKIDYVAAEFTFRTVVSPRGGWFAGTPLFDVAEEEVKRENALKNGSWAVSGSHNVVDVVLSAALGALVGVFALRFFR